jgi:hypothetical protein
VYLSTSIQNKTKKIVLDGKKKSAVSGMDIVFLAGTFFIIWDKTGETRNDDFTDTIDFHLPPKLAIFCFSSMKQQGERRRGIWSAH